MYFVFWYLGDGVLNVKWEQFMIKSQPMSITFDWSWAEHILNNSSKQVSNLSSNERSTNAIS